MALSTVIACTVYAFINGWKLSLVVLAFIPLLVVASAIQMRVFAGGKVSDHGEDELVQSGKVRFTTYSSRKQYFPFKQHARECVSPCTRFHTRRSTQQFWRNSPSLTLRV